MKTILSAVIGTAALALSAGAAQADPMYYGEHQTAPIAAPVGVPSPAGYWRHDGLEREYHELREARERFYSSGRSHNRWRRARFESWYSARLAELDARVRHLRRRLDGMVVVDAPPSDPRRVFFGARVTLEDAAGNERTHRIVGPDEFAEEPGGISLDAPLARALLGKALDSEVGVQLAGGEARYVITAIEYPPADAGG